MAEVLAMISLIDRADGTPFCQLTPEDFRILQQQLVRESEDDFDYYLTDATLELLGQAGLSQDALAGLSARMRHRGLDVGWVLGPGDGESYSGSLVDSEVIGLGGIRVDLMSSQGMISWTYSGPEGDFEVFGRAGESAEYPEGTWHPEGTWYLRLSGRGNLVLRHLPLDGPGDQGQFEIQTLRGSVATEDGEPLSAVTVLLSGWKAKEKLESSTWTDLGGQRSWGDSDDEGRFSIPVSLPEDVGPLQLDLELTAVSGQTLETLALTVNSEAGFDLGVIRAPKPMATELPIEPELVVE